MEMFEASSEVRAKRQERGGDQRALSTRSDDVGSIQGVLRFPDNKNRKT